MMLTAVTACYGTLILHHNRGVALVCDGVTAFLGLYVRTHARSYIFARLCNL